MRIQDPLYAEIENLRIRLAEALEALEAIRSGDVDALVVYEDGAEKVYTLQGAEQPYRVMVEAMNEGAATLSEDGLILWSNTCLADFIERPLGTLLGTPMLTHLAPESRPAFKAILAQPSPEGQKIEIELQSAAGKRVPVLLSVSPFSHQAHSANLILIFTDLTEQKRSAELAAAERMAAAIIDQAAQPMVVCDRQGRVVRASQSAHKLAGKNPLNQPFAAAYPLRFDQTEQDALAVEPDQPHGDPFSLPAVLDGQVIHGVEACLEHRLTKKRTEPIHLTVSAAPLRLSEDGQIWGCVITMTDLSARKQAEEQVRSYAALLERSNRDLQDFAFVASHDLQEPLRKIRSFGARLKEESAERLTPESLDYIERMQNAEERMRKMIDELLSYSRIATRVQPFEPVALGDICEEVLTDMEVQLAQTEGRVEVEKLPVIDADPMQMRQLLQNLLSNSLKFHQDGVPPHVHLRAKRIGHSKVELSISDNGIGFSMEHADLIFQPFKRLHGRAAYDGNGIGLAICRRIVERHNGEIAAAGEPGKGATFTITLPIHQDNNEPAV